MDDSDVTVFICIACKGRGAVSDGPGRQLFDTVTATLGATPECTITVKPVNCLVVCNRPCTVALAGSGKWTYVVGDLDHQTGADDVISAARSYGATKDGIIPWRQRPQSFRKGLVSRIPPLGFSLDEEI